MNFENTLFLVIIDISCLFKFPLILVLARHFLPVNKRSDLDGDIIWERKNILRMYVFNISVHVSMYTLLQS